MKLPLCIYFDSSEKKNLLIIFLLLLIKLILPIPLQVQIWAHCSKFLWRPLITDILTRRLATRRLATWGVAQVPQMASWLPPACLTSLQVEVMSESSSDNLLLRVLCLLRLLTVSKVLLQTALWDSISVGSNLNHAFAVIFKFSFEVVTMRLHVTLSYVAPHVPAA